MRYKLHQRTKNIVEYTNETLFNHLYNDLFDFLRECDVSIYENGDNWEIQVSELEKAIEYLGNCEQDKIVFDKLTAKELKETFEKWIETNEKNKDNFTYPDYIYLDWF